MELLPLAFLAGILTVLSPCVLPLLPVVLAGSAAESNRRAPYIIIASLAVSAVLFTLLIKATTVLLGVPSDAWLIISGAWPVARMPRWSMTRGRGSVAGQNAAMAPTARLSGDPRCARELTARKANVGTPSGTPLHARSRSNAETGNCHRAAYEGCRGGLRRRAPHRP
ncbi:cytochrome c biogenesis CcdA family protein [Pseudarthrobacter sp. S3]|uniref:cytochrome c biogenesis CcdA family protein n=1 Tax=unclassified Pseudarthrobacter TaxID=2647000 RepID=UPI003CF62BD6